MNLEHEQQDTYDETFFCMVYRSFLCNYQIET
jgi:hypothetical protein